jgi:hypothetical protein
MARPANESLVLVWKQRLARHQRSQLSAAEFCSQEGISLKSFYAWRKRLQTNDSSAPRSSMFVPVELSAESDAASEVRLELPSGVVVTLPATSSPKLVAAAIRAVMSSSSSKERASC